MTLWFDQAKQVYRINISKGNRRFRKVLPRDCTEDTARAIHAKLLNDAHRIAAAVGMMPGWQARIANEVSDQNSWFWATLKRCERRAKAMGREFGLTQADFEFVCLRSGGRCELTGIPFSDALTNGRRPYFQSIDRIDCARGYTIDNVRLVCLAVNIAISNWGDQVLAQIAIGLVLNRFYPAWLSPEYANRLPPSISQEIETRWANE